MARRVYTSAWIGSILVLVFGIAAPAQAQFVCGGSATGAEPQSGGTSTAAAGSVACGIGVTAGGAASISIGTNAGQLSPGTPISASGTTSIAIGAADVFGVSASGANSIAIGTDAQAGGAGGVAIGSHTSSGSAAKGTAIGDRAFINPGYINSTAIGGNTLLNGSNTTLLGANATTGNADSNNSVAVGAGVVVGGGNSTAVGQGSTATALGATALGQGASATFANSAAIGAGVTTTRANQVAVGTSANTYTLAGVSSAASLAAQSGPLKVVTTDAAGNLATASFAPQDISTLQSNVGVLQQQMKQAFEGTAIAIALGGTALPDNKTFAISTNWGNFRGQNAAGVSAQYRINNNIVANVGVGGGFQQGGIGSRAGVTLAW